MAGTWWLRSRRAAAEWVHADVRDPAAMELALERVDAVVHTAYRHGSDEWSTNVDGAAVARGCLPDGG